MRRLLLVTRLKWEFFKIRADFGNRQDLLKGKAFTTSSSTSIDDFTTIFGFHSFAKTACRSSFLFTRLICTLHFFNSLSSIKDSKLV